MKLSRSAAVPFPAIIVAGIAAVLLFAGGAIGLSKVQAPPTASPVVKVVLANGHGSGVHIGDGYIVTVAHVTGEQKTVDILTDDGVTRTGEVLWGNSIYDVALVRIKDHLPAAADLDCRIPPSGEPVLASGNPRDMEFLTFRGHISGIAREIGPWKVAVPVDLTIIGGMSGGPVYDADMDVVGLSVGHMLVQIGFAASWARVGVIVPAHTVCSLMGRSA